MQTKLSHTHNGIKFHYMNLCVTMTENTSLEICWSIGKKYLIQYDAIKSETYVNWKAYNQIYE